MDGPFPWVLWVVIGGVVMLVLLALAIPLHAALAGIAIGTVLTVMFASLLYQGLRTGIARGRVIDYAYEKQPFGYGFQMAFNVFMSGMGLFMIGFSIRELLR